MAETQDEIIEQLEAKVQEYENLLEETLSDKKGFGKILAGPFDHDGKKYYRVSIGSDISMVYAAEVSMFDGSPIDPTLPEETEVIVVGQTIACVVPEELKVIIEPPVFDLISWSDIGGFKSQLQIIRDAIELPMVNAKLAEELGVQPICGILLYGAPGCGKTYIAKAIASTVLGATRIDPQAFQYMKGGEMLSMYVGKTEQDIKNSFAQCRDYTKRTGKKAIMFIDEAEALLPTRGSRRSSDVETTIVPTFLSEMSGFEGNNPIVILATNKKDAIDEAILREGRIDIKIEIKRPTEPDALEIFEIHLKKLKTHDAVADLAEFASSSLFGSPAAKKVSGAMIEAICKDAIRKTMTRVIATPKTKEKGITLDDMSKAITAINTSYVTTKA